MIMSHSEFLLKLFPHFSQDIVALLEPFPAFGRHFRVYSCVLDAWQLLVAVLPAVGVELAGCVDLAALSACAHILDVEVVYCAHHVLALCAHGLAVVFLLF